MEDSFPASDPPSTTPQTGTGRTGMGKAGTGGKGTGKVTGNDPETLPGEDEMLAKGLPTDDRHGAETAAGRIEGRDPPHQKSK